MYYQSTELNSIVLEWGQQSTKEIKSILKGIREEIRENCTAYRNFGGYWKLIKPLVYSRSATNFDTCVPVLPAALRYRSEQDIGPNALLHQESLQHIWENPNGEAELISVYDAALEGSRAGQLDLFVDLQEQEQASQAFLTAPQEFLPRTWKERGDEMLMTGDCHRAVRCYKRSALLSQDPVYRGEMWLAMGLAYESAEHHRKALLCFSNAYEKAQEGWILGHIAHSCRELGKLSEAKKFYQDALKQMPGNPEYIAALEELDPPERSIEPEDFNFISEDDWQPMWSGEISAGQV